MRKRIAAMTRALLLLPLLATSALAADFPQPYNSEPGNVSPPAPADALASLKLQPGFAATIFAHEPEVENPIAMAFDGRGRMWVAENFTYAEKGVRFDLALRDRVLVFEDKDGDGIAESRKVFTDEVQVLTSVAVGRGGVWLMCPPQLLFVPDADGDDVPDSAPQVVLDGFTVAKDNYHNFANGLKWGPDGWLYGRCGASCPGEIGVPGTLAEARVPLRGGMWRYHPEHKIFEALTHGTTNPWGQDWDARGELFFVNTVNGFLWHAFAGAHFVRPHTTDPNPHSYALIDTHADHYHFDTGKSWTASRNGAANDFGGGHSHEGALIYQGGSWPAEYAGKLFTLNLHGRRMNTERLERIGSGFVAKHEPDFALWGDPWFRGIELQSGPDGSVFALDWSDTGECHDSTGVHRTSGRIYKIAHSGPGTPLVDSSAHPAALDDLRAENIWPVRRELLALQEGGESSAQAHPALLSMYRDATDPVVKLRAMWALASTGGSTPAWLREQLAQPDESVRVWAIRLLTDDWPLDTATGKRPARAEAAPDASLLAEFLRLAHEDPSGLVRLALASTLQRLPVKARPALATALFSHAEDATDHNLPLLVWYGLTPLAAADLSALPPLAMVCEWPITRRCIARRIAAGSEKNPAPLDDLLTLAATRSGAFQSDILTGLSDAFAGWRKAAKPSSWEALQAKLDPALADRARDLSALFGDGRALDQIKHVALDSAADVAAREAALRTLIDSRPDDLRAVCESLLDTHGLNITAVRGLALFDDPALGASLVKRYAKFSANERPAVIAALVTRPAWVRALLDGVASGAIPRSDIGAFDARQIRSFNDAVLAARLTEVWGEMRESAADKRELIAKLKMQLTPQSLAKADVSKGRAAFNTVCGACHTLYGEGGKIGPDLTGSGRDNLDYLLENIVDPSAIVPADFRLTTLTLKDGRILTGMIAGKSERVLTLRTLAETLPVERADIANLTESPQSMMPEGVLGAFTPEQTRDLFSYLMSKQQAPLPTVK